MDLAPVIVALAAGMLFGLVITGAVYVVLQAFKGIRDSPADPADDEPRYVIRNAICPCCGSSVTPENSDVATVNWDAHGYRETRTHRCGNASDLNSGAPSGYHHAE